MLLHELYWAACAGPPAHLHLCPAVLRPGPVKPRHNLRSHRPRSLLYHPRRFCAGGGGGGGTTAAAAAGSDLRRGWRCCRRRQWDRVSTRADGDKFTEGSYPWGCARVCAARHFSRRLHAPVRRLHVHVEHGCHWADLTAGSASACATAQQPELECPVQLGGRPGIRAQRKVDPSEPDHCCGQYLVLVASCRVEQTKLIISGKLQTREKVAIYVM